MTPVDIYIGKQWVPWFISEVPSYKVASVYCEDVAGTTQLREGGFNIDGGNWANFGISLHWQKIFTAQEIAKYKFLMNIHPGLIPESRGTFPVFWDLLNNVEIGVSVHQITEILDFGPYLFREEVSYGVDESMTAVFPKVRQLEENLFLKTLDILNSGKVTLTNLTNQKLGPERRKAEFNRLRDFGPDLPVSPAQKKRLLLAFDHPEFEIPSWLKN